MIRNVIFDFGGVLFEWNPRKIAETFTQSSYEQDLLLNNVLKHTDWLDLDRGTMFMAEVIPKFAARTGFPEARMEDFIHHIQNSLHLIEETKALLDELIAKGFHVYYLTNMSSAFFDTLYDKHDFIDDFHGGLVSARELLLKPEPAIFQRFMEKYGLQPESCFFIDDNTPNVETARQLGMAAFHFTATEDCYRDIRSILRLTHN
ncbi:HAD family phosphatase (plasmid) [Photobacterium sp. GJ3]|uniref:HAD family hydrolase n=1 Tax=Photobacterium sp. GJ3 TaxID=2829502 RepID=UPI001B8BA1E3|nr:HAD family phosphatase [Photobacterium sp. GJ3]QUJ70384.1 HAD family phosphatase [Photobacterium sp. GJ3]